MLIEPLESRFCLSPLIVEGANGVSLNGLRLSGGQNNLEVAYSHGVSVIGGCFNSPKGPPSTHNILLDNTRDVIVRGVHLGSRWARGDAVSSFNSSNVIIDRVRITGSFDMKTDKSASVVIDGTGRGGVRNVIRNVRVHKIVIAAGGWHRLENVRADVVEISGAAYEGNPRRLVHDIRLVNCQIGWLWIDPKTVKRVTQQ